MTFLLDVNVLIALIDPKHAAHADVHQWFETQGHVGWATCPLTENGLVRIISNPKYTNYLGSTAEALALLGNLYRLGNHVFWEDSISLLDAALVDPWKVTTLYQVTDTYLLALAVANRGYLATLDRRLSPIAVLGGEATLRIIAERS